MQRGAGQLPMPPDHPDLQEFPAIVEPRLRNIPDPDGEAQAGWSRFTLPRLISFRPEYFIPPGSPPYEYQLSPAVGAACTAYVIARDNNAEYFECLFTLGFSYRAPWPWTTGFGPC